MTRLSAKTIIQGALPPGTTLNADFNKSEIDLTVRDKGYNVLYEKALKCPCKSQGSDNQNQCMNCGGGGWLFVNPTLTKMVIHSVGSDRKYKEVGRDDLGKAEITCLDGNILSFMDRITILDGLTDHNEVLFPTLSDDGTKLFSFTKYNLIGVDYLGLFGSDTVPINQLIESRDYTFHDNVIEFTSLLGATQNPTGLSVTIRYLHAPVYHIIDITRDTMRSTTVDNTGKRTIINLPIHAIGVRAHLVKDQESYTGNRLIDNSYLASCDTVNYKSPVLPGNSPFYIISASSIGTGVSLYDSVTGRNLNFRNLVAGANVSLSLSGHDIIISSSGGSGGLGSVTHSSSSALTLGSSGVYVFNGTSTSWTLPPAATSLGISYFIKNIGSGNIILNEYSGDSNVIYYTAAVSSITIPPGSALIIVDDGTYWDVM